MMKLLHLTLLLLTLSSCGESEPKIAAETEIVIQEGPCRLYRFEESRFTLCTADPAKHRILTRLNSKKRQPYGGFKNYADENKTDGIAFAMNGGMYDNQLKPIGYYSQGKDRLKTLNLKDGTGNFHLNPNGVFFGSEGKWQVVTSKAFYNNVSERPQFGTQSGPMLVIDGKLHPKFSNDGASKHIRNGVGVDKVGRAQFVISEEPVSFGRMGRFMRDVAKTPNALYLDGTVSSLWDPSNKRMDSAYPLGPLLIVETIMAKKTQAAKEP